ncbi:MAG TPA: NAD(P)-dependent oxidoreductase [Prolixibacteraceae bacterium]|nr:MAG: NAD(P)-dependent oxidoreductase [Bacteroidetes bacterium GWB2_41_8]HCY42325.1 NAD(P)-dependent oxidoreductase [Prolixibacteraceae bacterium]
MNQKIALITGATAGIGYETAFLLAQNNYNLILTGRRKERLETIKKQLESNFNCKVLTLNFDIRKKAEVESALTTLPEEWQSIDVLLNNAGLAAGLGPVNSADVDDWETMIDTNVKGLLYMTRIVSPWMVARQSGHIINISSIAGKEAYPNGSVYCGTKHAVAAITKAMRIELMPSGIKVSSIAPGAVETEFSLVRFRGDEEKAAQVYKGFTPLSAKDIAETILFVLSRPPHVNIDDLLIMPTNQASARDFNRK